MNMEAILALMNTTQAVVKLRFKSRIGLNFFRPFLLNYIDDFTLY